MALSRQQRLSNPRLNGYDRILRMNEFVIKLKSGDNFASVLVPKRVIPKAHDRNRIRRQCSEVLRKAFKVEPIGSISVQVVKKPEGCVTKSLTHCLQKIRSTDA